MEVSVMKKWLLIISATVICVAAAFLYFFSLTPKGDTITSRESILNTAISKGNEWTIAKELELGGYIVSGAYSADNKSTLAIFEPTGNGDYKFSTSTNRNSDEIIVGGVAINGEWYDLITEAQAQEILQDVPTPFHVYDEKGIRENARRINKAFSWNKGFREYFAVKALPNPVILQILKEEGCGVDCSSLTELMLSEVCGFTGSDIMFSSNQTPVEDMKKAYELGAYINLDDATMVDFLDRVAGVPENIFCRYNPGGTFQLGESEEGFQVMDKPGDAKYGMTEEQMIDSYKKLMQKGAKNFGIHAFLASNTISDAYYPELAGILFQLAVRVQKATGAHIAYINLSGGVGIPYRPDQTENDIMAIGEGVRKKFEEILVPAGMGDVAIFTEMGRFTTGPYGALVATAIHEKHIYKEYIGLDACAANLMRPAMYGAYHHITVLGKENEPCDHMYDVVGGLCENNDKFGATVASVMQKVAT